MANLPLSNIFYRKTRTGVGILAVAIEVALVLVLVGLAYGTIDESADRMKNVGADVIFQSPDSSPFLVLNTGVMSERLTEKLSNVRGVGAVAPVLTGQVTRLKDKNKFVMIFGVRPETYDRIGRGIQIVEGRGLENPDDLVVDTVLAAADDLKVGDSLTIMNRHFRLSGICKAGAGVRIYMGLDTLQEVTAQPGKVSLFFVKAEPQVPVAEVAAALEKRFEGYKVTALEGFTEELRENALGMKEFVRAVSILALLISFLVILLAMYTTVIERTREIGILKALGAGKLYIVRLVLAESFVICFLGVMVGYLLSVLGRLWVLMAFPTLTVALMPRWFLIAALLGICGGLVGAVYPAYRAARLDPVEALNFE
ncbi:MAG: ABC transporter permease [Acidobacteriota bacterium]